MTGYNNGRTGSGGDNDRRDDGPADAFEALRGSVEDRNAVAPDHRTVREPAIGADVVAEAKRRAAGFSPVVSMRDGRFVAGCDEFPGIRGWGVDESAAIDSFRHWLVQTIATMLQAGVGIPRPGELPERQVTKCVKMGSGLAARAEAAAKEKSWSFSALVRAALTEYIGVNSHT